MSERTQGWLRTKWAPAALVMLGLAIRLGLAPWGAHPGDVVTLARWAEAVRAAGWTHIYALSDANYPPLGTLLVAGSALFAPGSRAWLVAIKLPAILADAGIMGLVWQASAGQRRGRRLTWLASAALNPALIIMSGWWGQFESVYALAALASVWLAFKARFGWAGVALGAAALVKVQGIVVLPVVGLIAAKTFWLNRRAPLAEQAGKGRRDVLFNIPPVALLVAGFGAMTLAGFGPFIAQGQGRFVLERTLALVAGPGWLTVNATNLWYLVSGGAGNWGFNAPLVMPDSTAVLGGASARAVGLALLGGWTGLVLGLAWRRSDRRGWLLAAALLYLGVFLWPTQAHERYAFGAVVFGAINAALTPCLGRLRLPTAFPSPSGRGGNAVGAARPDSRPSNPPFVRAGAAPAHPRQGDDPPAPGGETSEGSTTGGWQEAAFYGIITGSHAANLWWAVAGGGRPIGLVLAVTHMGAALLGIWVLAARGDR